MTKPNEEQRQNLAILADYLRNLPKNYTGFRMRDYTGNGAEPEEAVENIHQCGTSACAVGHGPSAGLKPEPGMDWDDYEQEMFGVGLMMGGDPYQDWLYMFGPDHEDDATAAADRIQTYLQNDCEIPNDY